MAALFCSCLLMSPIQCDEGTCTEVGVLVRSSPCFSAPGHFLVSVEMTGWSSPYFSACSSPE